MRKLIISIIFIVLSAKLYCHDIVWSNDMSDFSVDWSTYNTQGYPDKWTTRIDSYTTTYEIKTNTGVWIQAANCGNYYMEAKNNLTYEGYDGDVITFYLRNNGDSLKIETYNGSSWQQICSTGSTWNGFWKYYKIPFPQATKLRLWFNCSANYYYAEVDDITVYKNHKPAFYWSDESGYENDGVEPEVGKPNINVFTFRVRYTDIDNDMPESGNPRVVIKSGTKIVKALPMNYVTGYPAIGMIYSATTTLSGGSYNYQFEANDGLIDAVPLTNSGPLVSTVSISGYVKTPAGQSMGNVTLNISGTETFTVKTDGSGYYSFQNLAYGGDYTVIPSSFSYYTFYQSSRTYSNVTSSQNNQNFTRTNTPPVFIWPGSPGYESDGVEPDVGNSTTPFIFKIKYTDPENDAPKAGYPKLYISGNGSSFDISEGFETGDFSQFAWENPTTSYPPWVVQSSEKHLGAFSAKSGAVSDMHETSLQVTMFVVDGAVSFYRKVSSEQGYDKLYFYVNNIQQGEWSGELDWANVSYTVTQGTHTFKWKYYKDISGSAGMDATWIDDVRFPVKDKTLKMVCVSTGSYLDGITYSAQTQLSAVPQFSYTFSAYDIYDASTTITSTGPCVQVDISGRIFDASNSPMKNVTVTLSGEEQRVYTTTADGYYIFRNINPGKDYVVIPSSLPYYSFNPVSRQYAKISIVQSNQDFYRVNSTNSAGLTWTGESGYETKGVSPVGGSADTTFTYRIKYTDPDNDAPKAGYPKLRIKKGGGEISGSPFIMAAADPQDTNFMDGKVYIYSTALPIGQNYTYCFSVYDIYNASSTTPQELTGPVVNNAPLLSWTGEAGYENDGVKPMLGFPTTSYIFRTKYTDVDNDAPAAGYPKLHVLSDGCEILSSPFTMTASNTGDTIYTDGKIYFYQTTLSTGIGYSYYLEAYDIFGASNVPSLTGKGPFVKTVLSGRVLNLSGGAMAGVKLELTGSEVNTCYTDSVGHYEFIITTMDYIITPSSFAYYNFSPASRTYSNTQTHLLIDDYLRESSAPVLSWTGESGYTAGGLDLTIGSTNTVFTYRIKYADADNDPPAAGYPAVVISTGGIVVRTIPMGYVSGNYFTGAVYSTSTILSPCSYYTYTFQAKDVWNIAATELSGTGPGIKTYLRGTVKDPGGSPMKDVLMTLSGSEASSCYTDSAGGYEFLITTMDYVVTPSSFAYYNFSPANRIYSNTQTHLLSEDFVRVSIAPVLDWTGEPGYTSDGIQPDISTAAMTITYRIKYTDADNDAPTAGYPRVIISTDGIVVRTIPLGYVSGNYLTCAVYSTSTILSPCSYYTYAFQTKDVWNTTGAELSGTGPEIKTYIKGYVKDPAANPMKDVTVTLSGDTTGVCLTNAAGYWEFTELTANSAYTVTPSSFPYYSFTPANKTYPILESHQTEQNFARNNNLPVVSFETDHPDGINLSTGQPNSDTFVFNLTYSDSDNDPPATGYPKLHILKNGVEISGSPFNMDAATGDYLTGAAYSHSTKYSEVGKYTYYFEVRDIWGVIINTPQRTYLVTCPPTVPENKSVNATDGKTVVSSEVILKWASVTADDDQLIYKLYVSSPQVAGFSGSIKLADSINNIYLGTATSYTLKNLVPGKTYYWRVDVVNSWGVVIPGPVWSFKTLDIPLTKTFNYPNPFNPNREKTKIVYKVDTPQQVKIKIYSEYGDLVYETEQTATAGTNEFSYDGKDGNGNILYNGSYICRIEKAEGVSKCYLLIIK